MVPLRVERVPSHFLPTSVHCFDLQTEKSNSEEKPLNDPNSEEGFEEFLKKMEQERQEKDRGRPPKLFNMNSHV